MDHVMIIHPRANAEAMFSAECRNPCRHMAIESITRWRLLRNFN